MSNSKITQFAFYRGRLPAPKNIMDEDAEIARKSRVSGVRTWMTPNTLGAYATSVGREFSPLVETGSVSSPDFPRIIESAKRSVETYWGVALNLPVQILSADDMLQAEISHVSDMNRTLRKSRKRIMTPALPSPTFLKHTEGKLVLSDEYIILNSQRMGGDVYYEGDAKPMFFQWNDGILASVLFGEMSSYAMRILRGETGENYIRMHRDMPVYALELLLYVISSGKSYSIARGMKDGGIPVLYRRLVDLYLQPVTQMSYTAAKALGDDIGIHATCLFDSIDIAPTESGPVIVGMLHGNHPDYERKKKIIGEAVRNVGYEVKRITVPESTIFPPVDYLSN
ncbi:MAG: hypothetical protein J4428_05455 [Candidatus Aenigmarchaeota archaeon]|nr:hypothetical protein [Candidatus Aenigmarchaeota archaeon]